MIQVYIIKKTIFLMCLFSVVYLFGVFALIYRAKYTSTLYTIIHHYYTKKYTKKYTKIKKTEQGA